jgi:hypothetical protein
MPARGGVMIRCGQRIIGRAGGSAVNRKVTATNAALCTREITQGNGH